MPEEASYGKRLHRSARAELRKFWSDYRIWLTFVSVIIAPILIQAFRHGWRSVLNLKEAVENGIIGLVISLVGTYLIAIRKGAESLDGELRHVIEDRDQSIGGKNQIISQRD